MTVAAGALFGLVLGIPLIPFVRQLDSNETGAVSDAEVAASPIVDAGTSSTSQGGGAGGEPSSTTASLPVPSNGPYLLADLRDGELLLTGAVPSQEAFDSMVSMAQITYAPFVRSSELIIDDQMAPVDWLANADDVIAILSLSINGSALVADGQIRLAIEVSTSGIADRLEDEMGEATGLPVILESVEVTNLQAPLLEIRGSVSQLSLAGRVPTEEIRTTTLESAVQVYRQGNVTNQVVADEAVHNALWMYDPVGFFESLYVFPELDIQVKGETVTGFVRGGYSFAPDSAEAVPVSDGVIDFAVNLMNRDRSLLMLIEAHTDPDGPDAANLTLSQDRAEVVEGYYLDAGISPDRITAVGKGETDLLTEDTSPEGNARNRRIEVKLSSLAGN